MSPRKKLHLSYWIAGLAVISMGAAYSVRSMIEIGPTATITGSFPEIRFLDTDDGDADWEIEANGDRFQIGLNSGGNEPFKIFQGANIDSLVIDDNGNVLINGEESQDFTELQVMGRFGSLDGFAGISITPAGPGTSSARLGVNENFDSFTLETRVGSQAYTNPIVGSLEAQNNTLTISDNGGVGVGGIPYGDVDADLHIRGNPEATVRLESPVSTPSSHLDWELRSDAEALDLWCVESSDPTIDGAPVTFFFRTFSIATSRVLNRFFMESNGDLGLGTSLPDASLHVFRRDAQLKVEESNSTVANRDLMELVNNGGVRFAMDNLDRNERWEFSNNSVGDFNISRNGTGGPEMIVSRAGRMTSGPGGFAALDSRPNGNLFIAGTLFESSDRDKKENFEDVDCEAVLKQISELEITTWNYKSDDEEIRHMGPVAQDFRASFQLGDSDKTIATTDKVGVSLAAIKALNSKLQAEATEKDLQIEALNERLEKLESAILKLAR